MQPLQVISKQEIEQIHQTTLRILSEVGIILDHSETRHILLEAGASIKNDRVIFPPKLVEKCLESCGGTVSIKGRNGKTVTIGDGTTHWHNLGGARDILDPVTGEARNSTVQDIRDSTRVLDAIENASTITPLYTPIDVPGEIMSLAMYRHALSNTIKPIHGPGVQTPYEVKISVEMAEVIGPASEYLSVGVSPVSPLHFPDDIAASIVEIARNNLSFGPLPCPTAGTTAPMSLAGALSQQNAEVLASVVIAQCTTPGLPIFYCGRLAMMEPKTGISVWGGVELGIASAATVQIGHYYGFPVNVYGLSTNALSHDLQNGSERAFNALMPALAGADELSGIGEMNAGIMSSLTQIVVDNEIVSSIKRIMRGFEVNQNSLALEVISSVMNGSGNFLTEKHTLNYMRAGEIYYTKLGERRTFAEWNRTGRKGMVERAHEEVERIIAQHEVTPLSNDQERELDKILLSAEKQLVNNK